MVSSRVSKSGLINLFRLGKNDIEQAIVDSIVDAVRDLRIAADKETEVRSHGLVL